MRVEGGGKVETLFCLLALQTGYRASRETLLHSLWPDKDAAPAIPSLNSLIYSLHKLLGDAIGDAAPVFYTNGYYQLNVEAGVAVDVARFDALADAGGFQARLGNYRHAVAAYDKALQLYQGDLCVDADVHAIIERERLRARCLALLAQLADYYYCQDDYATCLDYACRLLDKDPGREDAHRLIMRCYVRRGERAQALRQYWLLKDILLSEFDAVPEPATIALYDQVRLDPANV